MSKKIFIILTAILLFGFYGKNSFSGDNSHEYTGTPDISGTDGNGNTISLSQFRGKVVLLKFWASWCGPCIRSFPKTKILMDKYSSKGLVIFTVGLGNRQRDLAFLKSRGYNFSASIFMGRFNTGAYNVSGIPKEFLISKSGQIIYEGHPYGLHESLIRNALALSTHEGSYLLSNKESNSVLSSGISENIGNVDFSKKGPLVEGGIKYSAHGTIYPIVKSNFWGKWKMTRIGMIKQLHGYVEFKFTGRKYFNLMAAGGALYGRSRCYVKVTLNGKTINRRFFLNQWWNNYSINMSDPLLTYGVNTVRIYNNSVSVPWLYKAWTSLEKPAKTKFFR